jgi:uncharacterized protein
LDIRRFTGVNELFDVSSVTSNNDACVITGDFRGRTYGPFDRTLDVVRDALSGVKTCVFGALGNHDTAHIVPGLEAIGIRMLLNENEALYRDGAKLWIAGVDDPDHYRTDDLESALARIPNGEPTVLLAHSTDGASRRRPQPV